MRSNRWGLTAAVVFGLVCGTAGSAVATSLITGKQIKDGSIAPRDLNSQINGNLSKAGASYTGYAAWNDSPPELTTGAMQEVVHMHIPVKGNYLLSGKVVGYNYQVSPEEMDCILVAGADYDTSKVVLGALGAGGSRETIPLEVSHVFTANNALVALDCKTWGTPITVGHAKIQAVQVQTLKRTP